jgi:hypothetical protein
MDSQLLSPVKTQDSLFASRDFRASTQPLCAIRNVDQFCDLKEGGCIRIGRSSRCDIQITGHLSVSDRRRPRKYKASTPLGCNYSGPSGRILNRLRMAVANPCREAPKTSQEEAR